METCDYCGKDKLKVSPMLSNGYHICQECSDEPIETLDTMAQKNERERQYYKTNK